MPRHRLYWTSFNDSRLFSPSFLDFFIRVGWEDLLLVSLESQCHSKCNICLVFKTSVLLLAGCCHSISSLELKKRIFFTEKGLFGLVQPCVLTVSVVLQTVFRLKINITKTLLSVSVFCSCKNALF